MFKLYPLQAMFTMKFNFLWCFFNNLTLVQIKIKNKVLVKGYFPCQRLI